MGVALQLVKQAATAAAIKRAAVQVPGSIDRDACAGVVAKPPSYKVVKDAVLPVSVRVSR